MKRQNLIRSLVGLLTLLLALAGINAPAAQAMPSAQGCYQHREVMSANTTRALAIVAPVNVYAHSDTQDLTAKYLADDTLRVNGDRTDAGPYYSSFPSQGAYADSVQSGSGITVQFTDVNGNAPSTFYVDFTCPNQSPVAPAASCSSFDHAGAAGTVSGFQKTLGAGRHVISVVNRKPEDVNIDAHYSSDTLFQYFTTSVYQVASPFHSGGSAPDEITVPDGGTVVLTFSADGNVSFDLDISSTC